jgi:hypothetical protein
MSSGQYYWHTDADGIESASIGDRKSATRRAQARANATGGNVEVFYSPSGFSHRVVHVATLTPEGTA